MKRILITGASGGMGLETVKYLSMKEYYIYALDIKPLEEMKNVKSFIVDLTKKEEIEKQNIANKNNYKKDKYKIN